MPVKAVSDQQFKELFGKGWMTPEAASRRWGVTQLTIFAWLKQGKLEAARQLSGGYYLIDPRQPRP